MMIRMLGNKHLNCLKMVVARLPLKCAIRNFLLMRIIHAEYAPTTMALQCLVLSEVDEFA